MRMMVFDHRICQWRPWHGTRAAWLKLPHAVTASVCAVSTAALLSLSTQTANPPTSISASTASSPASADSMPDSVFVPAGEFQSTPPGGSAIPSGPVLPILASPPGGGTTSPPSTNPAPPVSLLVLTIPRLPSGPTPPGVPLLPSDPALPRGPSPPGGPVPPGDPVIADSGGSPAVPVPEPGSLALLAGPALLLAAMRRIAGLPAPVHARPAERGRGRRSI